MTQSTHMTQRTEDPFHTFILGRHIPAEIARSWLLVNAMITELFDQSAVSRADAIILDIEDAVDPSQKNQARGNVIDWLSGGGKA